MLKPYLRIQQAAGVHIHIGTDGALDINVCLVKASGNNLELTVRKTGLHSVEEIDKHLPAKCPVALNLSGRGVLIKNTDIVAGVHAGNFGQLFPNVKYEDFYLQQFVSGERSFIALIRKTEANKWIKELNDLNLQPLMLSIGPFALDSILPHLNFYGEDIAFAGHRIKRNNKQHWLTYQYDALAKAAFPIKLESEKLDEQLILAYAVAFQLILSGDIETVHAEVPQLKQKLESVLADKKLTLWSGIALGLLFLLLLINFMLFTHYEQKNQSLGKQIGQTARNVTDQENVSTRIKEKEGLLDSLGWDGGVNKSVLIDQIAQLRPEGIILNEWSVNPVSNQSQVQQKSIHFMDRQMRIKGTSAQVISVNEWLGRIKTLKTIKKVDMENYHYNSEEQTGEFTLVIVY